MQNTPPTPRQIAKNQGLTRYEGPPCKYGHLGERFVRNSSCIKCHKLATKITKNGQRARRRARKAPLPPPSPKTDFEKWIVRSKAGKKRNHRKALSPEYYKTIRATHCPLLGLELSYENFTGKIVPPNYASLDRIDSQKGYEEGNVQIISYRANVLKNSATLEEMKMIVANWEKHTSA